VFKLFRIVKFCSIPELIELSEFCSIQVFNVRVRGIPYSGLFRVFELSEIFGISEIVPELSNFGYSRDYSEIVQEMELSNFAELFQIVRIFRCFKIVPLSEFELFQNCSGVFQDCQNFIPELFRIVKICIPGLFNYSGLFQDCQFTVFKLFRRLSNFAVFQELIRIVKFCSIQLFQGISKIIRLLVR
jgi:hypothetical protein